MNYVVKEAFPNKVIVAWTNVKVIRENTKIHNSDLVTFLRDNCLYDRFMRSLRKNVKINK